MSEFIEIICDTQDEADVAVAWCKQKGVSNVTVRTGSAIHILELEGNPPYEFRGRFSKMSPVLFIVSGEE